jgi:uncharacterized damage-inducible protein DinB
MFGFEKFQSRKEILMTALNQLKELFNHMFWADAKIWDTVFSIPGVQNHEKLQKLLHHLHLTQYAFYFIWSDLPLEFPKRSEFKNLNELATWASKYPVLLQSFISGLKEEDLNEVIDVPWSKRLEKLLGKKPAETNLAETILQVSLHSSYHRGQVNSYIRSLNSEPPLIDFIAWIWLGKPVAAWPESIDKQ